VTDETVMRDVALIAAAAVSIHLGYPFPDAASVEPVPDHPRTLVLHVIGLGNARACADKLHAEGFRVSGMAPDGFGMRLRVTDERGAS
jgi:hypothetical protein